MTLGRIPRSNLPRRAYRRLVGRQKNAQQLIGFFKARSKGPNALLIYGSSGVGKTSLALEVGHFFLENYSSLPASQRFEAIIWVSAQPLTLTVNGFSESAFLSRNLEEVITLIAITIDSRDILKGLPEDQILLTLKALSLQSVLLIVDNLETMLDDRVSSFLRQVPESTSVLATSRVRYDLGSQFRLKPLGQEDSVELIRELEQIKQARLTDLQRIQLFELSGGIPLAMVWTVALISHGYEPSSILDSLAESKSDILEFCFSKAWRLLENRSAEQLLLALAFFSSSASRTALGYVAGVEGPEIDNEIALLERLSLLDVDEDRLSALPMTKAYLVNYLSQRPDRKRELQIRWSEFLLLYVRQSLQSSSWEEAFSELDLERENIIGLLNWVSSHGEESEVHYQASVVFHDISYYLYSRGYWSTLLSNEHWALSALWEQELIEEYLVVSLSWIVRVHIFQDSKSKIGDRFAAAQAALDSLHSSSSVYSALLAFNYASVLRREGKDIEALDQLDSAIRVFHQMARKEWEASALNRLGNTYAALGRFEEARKAYQEVIQISKGVEGTLWAREMLAIGKGNLGIMANRAGDSREAIKLLTECEPLLTQLVDKAVVFMELAIAYCHRKRFRKSIEFAQKSRQMVEGLDLAGPIAESDPAWEIDVLPELRPRIFPWLGWLRSQYRRRGD